MDRRWSHWPVPCRDTAWSPCPFVQYVPWTIWDFTWPLWISCQVSIDSLPDPFLNTAKYKWPDLGAFQKFYSPSSLVLISNAMIRQKQEWEERELTSKGVFQSINSENREIQGPTLSRSLHHTLLNSLSIYLAQDLGRPGVSGISSTHPLHRARVRGGTHSNEAGLWIHETAQGGPHPALSEG